jgi:hypothetical protein
MKSAHLAEAPPSCSCKGESLLRPLLNLDVRTRVRVLERDYDIRREKKQFVFELVSFLRRIQRSTREKVRSDSSHSAGQSHALPYFSTGGIAPLGCFLDKFFVRRFVLNEINKKNLQ